MEYKMTINEFRKLLSEIDTALRGMVLYSGTVFSIKFESLSIKSLTNDALKETFDKMHIVLQGTIQSYDFYVEGCKKIAQANFSTVFDDGETLYEKIGNIANLRKKARFLSTFCTSDTYSIEQIKKVVDKMNEDDNGVFRNHLPSNVIVSSIAHDAKKEWMKTKNEIAKNEALVRYANATKTVSFFIDENENKPLLEFFEEYGIVLPE